MRELANVLKVEKLEPIEGKDRIELATVENWNVIVQKGQFSVGDLVVYVEYDTILPTKPEFEFLRKRCYSKSYDGFRIRNMSMGGVFSQGIVFPMTILPEGENYSEGQNVAKELGVVRYAPEDLAEKKQMSQKKYSRPVNFLLKFKFFRRIIIGKKKPKYGYPETVTKSDEVNIQKMFQHLKKHRPNELYYKSEKMEGQAASFMLYGKKKKPEYRIYSHNALRFKGDGSNWDRISEIFSIESLLRIVYENTGIKYSIQGEICMQGVQKNIYGFDMPWLFVYRVTDTDTGASLNFDELKAFCVDNTLPMVPVLETNVELPDTIEEILEESNGYSVFGDKVPREGIVWRSMRDQSVGFKARSPSYMAWWEKNDATK